MWDKSAAADSSSLAYQPLRLLVSLRTATAALAPPYKSRRDPVLPGNSVLSTKHGVLDFSQRVMQQLTHA